MLIAGIDPGITGAIAIFNRDGNLIEIVDMPVLKLKRGRVNRSEIDAHLVADLFEKWRPTHAFLEQTWSRPAQAMASASAREGYGIIKGVLAALGIPFTALSPQKWKRALAVPAAKDGARARASQLLPGAAKEWQRKKDDGRAEAALIGLYGVRFFQAISTEKAAAE